MVSVVDSDMDEKMQKDMKEYFSYAVNSFEEISAMRDYIVDRLGEVYKGGWNVLILLNRSKFALNYYKTKGFFIELTLKNYVGYIWKVCKK